MKKILLILLSALLLAGCVAPNEKAVMPTQQPTNTPTEEPMEESAQPTAPVSKEEPKTVSNEPIINAAQLLENCDNFTATSTLELRKTLNVTLTSNFTWKQRGKDVHFKSLQETVYPSDESYNTMYDYEWYYMHDADSGRYTAYVYSEADNRAETLNLSLEYMEAIFKDNRNISGGAAFLAELAQSVIDEGVITLDNGTEVQRYSYCLPVKTVVEEHSRTLGGQYLNWVQYFLGITPTYSDEELECILDIDVEAGMPYQFFINFYQLEKYFLTEGEISAGFTYEFSPMTATLRFSDYEQSEPIVVPAEFIEMTANPTA